MSGLLDEECCGTEAALGSPLEDNCDDEVEVPTVAAAAEPPAKKGPQRRSKDSLGADASKTKCKACDRTFETSTFPTNRLFCWNCKRALDNISYQAKSQGTATEQWLRQTRQNPNLVKRMLASYRAKCPEQVRGRGKKRSSTWSLLQYIETYKAETRVTHQSEGQMMWEKHYISWAQQPEGGKLSEDEAIAKWKDYVNDPQIVRDQKGPAKAPLRLRIPVRDMLNFSSSFARGKEMDKKQKDIANANEDDVEKLKKQLLKDHGRGLGHDGSEGDFANLAEAMVATAGEHSSGCFAGAGALLPDVRTLLEAEDDSRTEAPASVAAEPPLVLSPHTTSGSALALRDDESSRTPKKAQKGKATKWFDADRALAKATRTVSLALDKQRDSLDSALTVLKHAESTFQSMTPETLAFYQAEKKTAENRRAAVTAVLQDDDGKTLHAYMENVRNGTAQAPCHMHDQIQTLTQVGNLTPTVLTNTLRSDEDVASAMETLADAREPLAQLALAARKAAKDIEAAIAARERMEKQREKRAAKAAEKNTAIPKKATEKRRRVGGGAPLKPLFEYAPVAGATVVSYPTIAALEEKTQDMTMPFLLTDTTLATSMLTTQATAALADFRKVWAGASQRLNPGRAMQTFAPGSGDPPHNPALACLGKLPEPADANYLAHLPPGLFAVAQGNEAVFNEKNWLPTLRFTVAGTRSVVLASALALDAAAPQAMGSSGSGGTEAANAFQAKVWKELLYMTQERVVQFAQKHKLYHCTVGPNDCLFVPAGYVVAELVSSHADVVGIRTGVPCHARVEVLTTLTQIQQKCGMEMATQLEPIIKAVAAAEAAAMAVPPTGAGKDGGGVAAGAPPGGNPGSPGEATVAAEPPAQGGKAEAADPPTQGSKAEPPAQGGAQGGKAEAAEPPTKGSKAEPPAKGGKAKARPAPS